MSNFAAVMALGLFLGMRHAADPDHLIAVSTIVSRQRSARGALAIGAAWGVGHTLTILLVGGGIIVFGWVIPPRVGLSAELGVGVMLIALGVMNLRGVMRSIVSSVPGRENAPRADSHDHDASLGWLDRRFGSLAGYRLLRPMVVGVVHGLAGSAALALLVLATMREPTWALFYLLVFGVGTIAGMMLMTVAIVTPFAWAEGRFARVGTGLRVASGVISVAFGVFLAYRIGFVDGLFTGDARWTPH